MLKIYVLLLFASIVVGCSTTDTKTNESQAGEKKSVKNELTARGGKLEFDAKIYVVKKYDINKDKQPDIVNVFKKVPNTNGKKGEYDLQIFVKMMDLNHDTKIDVWRFFDESGAVTKEELDLDFDGKIDAIDNYLNGVVRRREIDFQFDEKIDIWKNSDEKGNLILLEADQSGDGKPDYWEFYANGVIERMEKDTDGDGKPDIFKRSGDKDFTKIMSTTDKFENKPFEEKKETPEDELPQDQEIPAKDSKEPASVSTEKIPSE